MVTMDLRHLMVIRVFHQIMERLDLDQEDTLQQVVLVE
tara:strand:+ start:243 stop:356 length:114 start_codon:yes stop_codon:yes gene_type:complete